VIYYSNPRIIRQLIVQVLCWVDPILCVNAWDDLSDNTNILTQIWNRSEYCMDSDSDVDYFGSRNWCWGQPAARSNDQRRRAPRSFGLSATSQQYFSLRTNQPLATSQQYFFSQNKSAPAISQQPNEQAGGWGRVRRRDGAWKHPCSSGWPFPSGEEKIATHYVGWFFFLGWWL
jgi:hypothetical protein